MARSRSIDRWHRHQNHQRALRQIADEDYEQEVRARKLTEDELEENIDRWYEDPEAFIEENLEVRHADGGRTVPFRLKTGQRILVRKVRWHLKCGRPVRILMLKSRRQWITTVCQALGYWYTSTRAFVEGLTVADKNDLVEEIFERGIKTFHRSDARKLHGIRPETEASNKRELKFGNPDPKTRDEHPGLQSVLAVTSAQADEPARGGTKHFVHGSEVPYWPEDPPPWQAIGIALSNAPGSIAILEGTANGAAGFFYDTWKLALRGKNEWTPIFLPWWLDPDNVLPLERGEAETWKWGHDYETADEEQKYAQRYRLSFEQLKWRRQIIASPKCYKPGRERIEIFRQEYPASEKEAWLSSSRNFFIPGKVDAWEEHPTKGAREPLFCARVVNEGPPLDDRGPGRQSVVKPVLEKDDDGEIAVWSNYDATEEYLVVCDPAEGLVGRDQSVIGVLARNAFDVVAMFRSTAYGTRELGQIAALLGWYFGRALVIVEANNQGGAVLQELVRLLYPRLWYHLDVTKPGSEPTDRPGWVQSHALRMYALKMLEAESRVHGLGLHDPEAFDQMRSFVWPTVKDGTVIENPKPKAMAGHFDDVVMMLAIMLGVHVNAPITKRRDLPKPPVNPESILVPEPMNLTMKQSIQKRDQRRIRGASLWGRGTRR